MTDEMFGRFRTRVASEMLRFPAESVYFDEFAKEAVPDHKALELARYLVRTFSEYPGLAELERVSKEFLGIGRPELRDGFPEIKPDELPAAIHCRRCGDQGQVDEGGVHQWCPAGCRQSVLLRQERPDLVDVFNRNRTTVRGIFLKEQEHARELARQREAAKNALLPGAGSAA